MRYNWLRDQLQQQLFDIFWAKSEDIESDYYSKHFTERYHRQKCPTHVLDKIQNVINSISSNIHSQQPDLQGCVSPGHTSPGPSVVSGSLGSTGDHFSQVDINKLR